MTKPARSVHSPFCVCKACSHRIAMEHKAADERCGRDWRRNGCQCSACRRERGVFTEPFTSNMRSAVVAVAMGYRDYIGLPTAQRIVKYGYAVWVRPETADELLGNLTGDWGHARLILTEKGRSKVREICGRKRR